MQQLLQQREDSESVNAAVSFASQQKLLLLHLTCGLGLASAFWAAFHFYSLTLIQNPAEILLISWAVEASVVIPIYSLFRRDPDQCPYVKAIARGLLGLLAGALVNAFVAIVLGAPVGIQHFRKTVHWSLLMSVFTVCALYYHPVSSSSIFQEESHSIFYSNLLIKHMADASLQFSNGFLVFFWVTICLLQKEFAPAASVFGSSWNDWHRVFAHTKPIGSTDFIICLPAHGAVIGAWFGVWPMPLDWGRNWQEWPVCVTYGAILGYVVGMVLSFALVVFHNRRKYQKGD